MTAEGPITDPADVAAKVAELRALVGDGSSTPPPPVPRRSAELDAFTAGIDYLRRRAKAARPGGPDLPPVAPPVAATRPRGLEADDGADPPF